MSVRVSGASKRVWRGRTNERRFGHMHPTVQRDDDTLHARTDVERRALSPQYLMPAERDGTLGVNLHEMFDLHQNGYLLQVKSNPNDPHTGSVTFSLGKLSHR